VRKIRTYADLEGPDSSGLGDQLALQRRRVDRRMKTVGAVLGVASGKGGVGKSFVAATLASAFARGGHSAGLLDADLNGPTAPSLLGLPRRSLSVTEDGVVPPVDSAGLRVFSTDLLLEDGEPLRWRGPAADGSPWLGALEKGAFREFLSDVSWGELDVLVVDLPPGAQRLVELAELVPKRTRALGLTIPTSASKAAVARSLRAAGDRGLPIAGLVENMSGYACGGCGEVGPLHPGDAGDALARELGLPLLARIPFDAEAGACAERGDMNGVLASRAGQKIAALVGRLEQEGAP
jgi:ATP-binding protein involved in chromosome partitioning